MEANLQKTIEKLEAEIKSREADIDKQQLEHQVSDLGRMRTTLLRQCVHNFTYQGGSECLVHTA